LPSSLQHLPSFSCCQGKPGLVHGSQPVETYLSMQTINRRTYGHTYGVEEVPNSLGNQICHRFPLHKADDSSPKSFKWSVYLNSRSIGSSTWRLICSFAVIQARWPLRALLKRLSSGTWQHSWCMYSMSMP
jgi:hypothetical protein